MAAQSIVCQAMPVNRPAPSKAAPAQTGPLARPAFSQVCSRLRADSAIVKSTLALHVLLIWDWKRSFGSALQQQSQFLHVTDRKVEEG